ncbi:MAG: dipeptide/oligopeptide/nickel ABC transporter ATP-binding protein [Actinobacteria bacterium]|nr:dipeptide/oligopeptide/nickel ABC transporter ATP-binding protein [Actinomycetota bacterium]
MTPTLLELRGVSKTFRRRSALGGDHAVVPAVADVSLSVEAGEIVALVGGSGAGKSTVGRMVLGLEPPDEGEVVFDGRDLAGMSELELRRVRQEMHLVFQDPYQSLHPGMRIGEVVEEPLVIAKVERQERKPRVLAALEEAGIKPGDNFVERFPHQLSGGQRQRVAMARALVSHPRLVVADEPTSMLDASLCAGILEVILDMRERQGTAFIFITHDLAVARYVSDRMIVMSEGRVIEKGPTETVIDCPCEEYTRLLLAASEGKLDEVEAMAAKAG